MSDIKLTSPQKKALLWLLDNGTMRFHYPSACSVIALKELAKKGLAIEPYKWHWQITRAGIAARKELTK
jgi:hypothetical protein